MTIKPFENAEHRGQVIALWQSVFGYESAHNEPGLVIDQKVAFDDRLFFVAVAEDAVVGTIMAGYDGHRGWIYSLAVAPNHLIGPIGTHELDRELVHQRPSNAPAIRRRSA
ncbi:MAG: hypothetical protein R3B91_00905 [Planctomycetaceae bacterium]